MIIFLPSSNFSNISYTYTTSYCILKIHRKNAVKTIDYCVKEWYGTTIPRKNTVNQKEDNRFSDVPRLVN